MSGSIGKIAVRLVIITCIAGLLLGLTYSVTAEPIAYQEELAKSESRKAVLETADSFEPVDLESLGLGDEYDAVMEAYYGYSGDEIVGVTVTISTKGYSSGLQVTIGVDTDGYVTGVTIDSHNETPGLGANADDSEYLTQYVGKQEGVSVTKGNADEDEVLAVTGATLTSKGICGAVNTACELYNDYLEQEVQ